MFGYRKKTSLTVYGSHLLLRCKLNNRKAAGGLCFNSKQWETHIYALWHAQCNLHTLYVQLAYTVHYMHVTLYIHAN